MLKKDHWALGIGLGIVSPLIIYLLLLMTMKLWGTVDEVRGIYIMKDSTMQLVGIFSNMFTFRYYMINLKYDKTGRGILLATFLYAGYFFWSNINF